MRELPEASIFDMDGTLVDVSSIRYLVRGGPRNGYRKNFDAFHRQAVNCPPHPWVVRAARFEHSAGRAVLIVTARSAKHRNSTAFWLAMHGVPSDAMWMRARGDQRPDYVVKTEILAKIRRSWRPTRAWDDNPHVLRLWEEQGIDTTVVPGWEHRDHAPDEASFLAARVGRWPVPEPCDTDHQPSSAARGRAVTEREDPWLQAP
jgi:phosphoglycolate phosphatase-like HAD superfamily hydrolase